jgi:acyl-CoA synthetase (AMP-forming)/AMP-acid ligase II
VREDFSGCAPGERGEVVVRGDQVFQGYWRKPELTEQAFRNGWFRTGDIGVLDERGALRIVDRLKNMIISGEVNIYPAEFERVIGAVDGVPSTADSG